ncbi:MAG TPA: F420-dependent methylenetetrahydromethanopterin dehydrogenase [Candidatus Deferrimicrobium sp.]|nr:F420-dependent methylenetetrahydromethanopterin dehydrogenase [Candidatus Deferrimicrobium sp.]
MVVKIGVVKAGNIGVSPVIDLLLDERADRENIDVRVVASGAKLNPDQCEEVAKKILDYQPQLAIFLSPNAGLPGPSKAREILSEAKIPTIIISDAPGKKAVEDIEAKGQGYLILMADSMIGARRPFLDPIEMALFNANILSVLAITGVLAIVYTEIDKVIAQIEKGETPTLPRIVVNKKNAIKAAGFSNPYAEIKAMAAHEICKNVADMNVEGCFKTKGREDYMPIVGAAHEMMRQAMLLADQAREIEKNGNTVLRRPHDTDGKMLSKRDFVAKPE